jgi:hypothetical protein
MDTPARGRRLNRQLASVPWPDALRGLIGVMGLALLVIAAVKFTAGHAGATRGAIREGRSRNEQLQAMVLAQKYWKRMSSSEQT